MKKLIKKIVPSIIGRAIKQVWLRFRGVYYAGSQYECPVCGHKFRKMLTGGFDLPVITEKKIVGGGRRFNDVCPRCQSTDRDRLVYLYLKYESDFFKEKHFVMHIAPEPALYNVFKKTPTIDYYPATKYEEGFYYDGNIQKEDLLELQLENDTFDWVLCNHVLEHIPDDAKAMSELYRVLKPGGKAILQVPYSLVLDKTFEDDSITDPKEREKAFGQFDHVRIYGKDYPDRLRKAGFEVKVVKQNWNFSNIIDFKRFALNPKEELFLCLKPNNGNKK
ncbi:MAG: methyltransferase domain-containing protein [Bacteroidales bacterium]|nr:methyltransferase domain-containing protein [Bacteroidales bacterium]